MAETHDPGKKVATSYQQAVAEKIPLREADGTLSYPSAAGRPRPDVRLDPLHRGLRLLSAAVPVGVSLYAGARLPAMPEQIPVHFGFDGSVSRYGSPWEGLGALLLLTLLAVGLAVLSRYPHRFNYPFLLTEHNVQRQYRNAAQMMVWLALSTAVISVGTANVWFGISGLHILWLGVVMMVGTTAVFVLRMVRMK